MCLCCKASRSPFSAPSVLKSVTKNKKHNNSKSRGSIQLNATPHHTIQYTMQCNAVQCNALQCNTMRCNAMQCDVMRCDAMRCDAIRYDTIRYDTTRHNTTRYNTIQYNTIQYNTKQYYIRYLTCHAVLRFRDTSSYSYLQR